MSGMNLRTLVASIGFTAVCLAASSCSPDAPPAASGAAPQDEKSPHIIVLIADDLGLDHSPCHSATVTMPFLRSMCAQSVVMDRMYSNPVCTPSRASLMTGRHTLRTHAGDVNEVDPNLKLDEVTLPEFIRAASDAPYRFSAFGKWHLADATNGAARNPNLQGFDHFEGTPMQAWAYDYFDGEWVSDGEVVERSTTYKTTKVVDAAIADFTAHAANAPQFQWVGFVSPHLPYHKPPAALHSQPDLPDVRFELTVEEPVRPEQFRLNRRDPRLDPYFDAMLESLDREIARLVGTITEASTRPVVFVFLGDNGTAGEVFDKGDLPGPRSKATLYEGGVRVPVMVWSNQPEALGLQAGRLSDLSHLVDLFPTLAELAGVPRSASARSDGRIDGINMRSRLSGEGAAARDILFLEHGNRQRRPFAQAAVDVGGLKLIVRETGRQENYAQGVLMEVYDLSSDPTEARNLVLDPCRLDVPRVRGLLDHIAGVMASEPDPYDPAFDPAVYRTRLDEIESSRSCG